MWIYVIALALLSGCAGGRPAAIRSAAELPHPDSRASLDERIHFYVERLGDTSYVAYRPMEDLNVEWYEAAEELGIIGAPAVPPLIDLLGTTTNDYERTQVFYALRLAAQDNRIKHGLGIQIPDSPMAYPGPAAHSKLREQWLQWWELHGEGIKTIHGAR